MSSISHCNDFSCNFHDASYLTDWTPFLSVAKYFIYTLQFFMLSHIQHLLMKMHIHSIWYIIFCVCEEAVYHYTSKVEVWSIKQIYCCKLNMLQILHCTYSGNIFSSLHYYGTEIHLTEAADLRRFTICTHTSSLYIDCQYELLSEIYICNAVQWTELPSLYAQQTLVVCAVTSQWTKLKFVETMGLGEPKTCRT